MVMHLVQGENLERSMGLGVRKPEVSILLHCCGYLGVGKLRRLPGPQKRDVERVGKHFILSVLIWFGKG